MNSSEADVLPFPVRALRPSDAPAWRQWQPETGAGRVRLRDFDPGAQPFSTGDKAANKAAVESLADELDELQELFYADGCFKLLLVLQGMDTSGKDGTVRGVFSRTSPLGVHTVGWKAPTERERAHDYLWRIHQQAPGAGEIMVFNRSHYEDVLVPVVNRWITPEQTRQRYRHINEFERLLAETGTVILKCLLHISHGEQRKRLQARIDNPSKHWKFSPGDVEVRRQWDDYQLAYEDLLNATSTAWAPWTIVPADSKLHRNLMIATLVRDCLKALPLRYPPENPALAGLRID